MGLVGRITVIALGVIFAVARVDGAPVAGQVSDFESGTTQGWGVGIPANNSTNVLGGPAGAQDNYLRVTATGGGGPGSRLITLNESAAWSGNFLNANLASVEMDLRNLGTTPLTMRVALRTATDSSLTSANAFALTLPADNQWHHIVFPLTSAALTPSAGTSYTAVMSNVRDFRILHSATADHRGDTIASSFGVDNIRLVGVPEPSVGLVVVAAVGGMMRRRR